MLGVAILSGVLFTSEVFVTYGAYGNSVLAASDGIYLETGDNSPAIPLLTLVGGAILIKNEKKKQKNKMNLPKAGIKIGGWEICL